MSLFNKSDTKETEEFNKWKKEKEEVEKKEQKQKQKEQLQEEEELNDFELKEDNTKDTDLFDFIYEYSKNNGINETMSQLDNIKNELLIQELTNRISEEDIEEDEEITENAGEELPFKD